MSVNTHRKSPSQIVEGNSTCTVEEVEISHNALQELAPSKTGDVSVLQRTTIIMASTILIFLNNNLTVIIKFNPINRASFVAYSAKKKGLLTFWRQNDFKVTRKNVNKK